MSEHQFEAICDAAQKEGEPPITSRQLVELFSSRSPKPSIVECPNCGRLALFQDMSDRVVFWYVPEKPFDGGRLRQLYSRSEASHE